MLVLGVETSCDDTAIGIVCSKSNQILANVVSSQHSLNAKYGGIVPSFAARSHHVNLPIVLGEAFKAADVTWTDIGVLAVTKGPGLVPCLKAGVDLVNELCERYPHLVPMEIHHLEGHALLPRLFKNVKFPFLALIVSGGHTSLIMVNDFDNYQVIGCTQDDALGEAFDKVGRLLDIKSEKSHVGAVLEQYALKGDPEVEMFPVPMQASISADFSFSGLKSAVARRCDTLNESDEIKTRFNIAAGFQKSAIDHLLTSTRRALVWTGCTVNRYQLSHIKKFEYKVSRDMKKYSLNYPPRAFRKPTALVVSGGVAANLYLRGRMSGLASCFSIPAIFPPANLCTDNGVMIAWAAIERMKGIGLNRPSTRIVAQPRLALNFRETI